MPTSLYMPEVTVEIAFDSGYNTPAASRTWTDVTAYVEAKDLVKIDRGRQDQFDSVTPSRLTLALDNRDGRFTPEYAAGAYYPNVKKGRPIRVLVRTTEALTGWRANYGDYMPLEDEFDYVTTISSPTSIQTAVNAAAAGAPSGWGLVLLNPGTWTERVVVPNNVAVVGTTGNPADVIVQAAGGTAPDFSPVNGDPFVLGGITFKLTSGTGTGQYAFHHTSTGLLIAEKCKFISLSATRNSAMGADVSPGARAYFIECQFDEATGTSSNIGINSHSTTAGAYSVVAYVDCVSDAAVQWGDPFGTGNADQFWWVGPSAAAPYWRCIDAAPATLYLAPNPVFSGGELGTTVGTVVRTTDLPPLPYHGTLVSGAPRFTGYVDEWAIEWTDGTASVNKAVITANSRMARLGRGAAFKSIVEEEILYDDPVLYWPLGEPEGATEAGNIAPARSERLVVTQVGSGGTLAFGAGTGPGTDDLTAPILTPVDATNGLYLRGAFIQPPWAATDDHIEFEVWFATTETSRRMPLVYLAVGSGLTGGYALSVNQATGGVTAHCMSDATTSTTVTSGGSLRDGNVHHAVFKASLSGSNLTLTVIADGVASSTGPAAWGGSDFFPAPTEIRVGGELNNPASGVTPGLFAGTLAHVALYAQATTALTNARFTEHYTAGSTGFNTEASGARVARYARLAGIPTAEIDTTETGLSTSIAHIDTTGQQPVGLMQDVTTTEDGLLFDAGDGVLTFQARSHRYGATSAFTLSCTAGEVEADLRPVLDDQGMVNDMTASRPGGATIRSVNQDSIDGTGNYGFYRDTVEIFSTSDNEVQARADWAVNRFGTPRVKLASITVDVINSSSAQITALLAAELGTRFTVSNLPAQAPASTMDFFIEGITEEIGPESYTISFNTSAAAYADVWIWDTSEWDETTTWAY